MINESIMQWDRCLSKGSGPFGIHPKIPYMATPIYPFPAPDAILFSERHSLGEMP